MLLSDLEIKKLNLVEDSIESHFRAVSYDLSIGMIITTDGKTNREKFRIQPQGIVEIVSREKVKLPKDIAGYVRWFNKSGTKTLNG